MNPRTTSLLCAALLAAVISSYSARADDEYITISSARDAAPAYPFESGAMGSLRANPGMTGSSPAVTLRRRAENVALAVTLANDSRQAEQRNRELLETLQRIVERAESTPGLRIHNGHIGLSTRDRKLISLGSYDTRTNISIFVLATLPEEKSALEVTNGIKQFLSGVQGVGQTRIIEGSVGLSIRDPEQYRRELLTRIVEDVHFVTEKLGGSVKVSLTGLDRPLFVRQRSDTEVELVISYGYTVEFQKG